MGKVGKVAIGVTGGLAVAMAIACGSGTAVTSGTKDVPITSTSPNVTPQPADPNTITGDGTFAVGTQVKPGTYRAVVPGDSLGCYYARLSTTDSDAIIDNGLGDPGSQQLVTIKSTDKYFETRYCGTWSKVSG